jgi:hypothetical protein
MSALTTKPSIIEAGKVRFMIMDAPNDTNLPLYLKECKKQNVVHIVRIADPTYSKDAVEKAGINLHVSFSVILVISSFEFFITFLLICVGNALQ